MQDTQSLSNEAISIKNNQYLRCAAGTSCLNLGIHFLSSETVHKIGLFCSFHRILLEEFGLVDSSYEGSPKMESNKKDNDWN